MLEKRGLYHSAPPPHRTAADDRPTLLVAWWCCACCLAIIAYRVVGRYSRTMRVFTDDKWMAASAVPLMARMGLIHAVLTLGTNNVDSRGMGEEEARRRELGSQLVLLARVMYTAFIWSQKFCITEFYKRLTVHFWENGYHRGLKIIRWSLLVTFAAAVISIFAECRPGHKLWQVKPDPGPQCRVSFLPLIFIGSLNVLTDLFLIFFPVPAILRSRMRTRTKLHLIFLFSLSVLPVATTLYRVPSILQQQTAHGQPYRTLWASIESLAACVCANAVILNSYARGRGERKGKFRPPSSEQDAMERRTVRLGTRVWGSDLELAADVGMGVDEGVVGHSNRSSVTFKTPYYYPPPAPLRTMDAPAAPAMSHPKWGFEDGARDVEERGRAQDRGQRVSFCDVGGLLREESPGGGGRRKGSGSGSEGGSEGGSAGGSAGGNDSADAGARTTEEVILNDVGGLLGTVVEGGAGVRVGMTASTRGHAPRRK